MPEASDPPNEESRSRPTEAAKSRVCSKLIGPDRGTPGNAGRDNCTRHNVDLHSTRRPESARPGVCAIFPRTSASAPGAQAASTGSAANARSFALMRCGSGRLSAGMWRQPSKICAIGVAGVSPGNGAGADVGALPVAAAAAAAPGGDVASDGASTTAAPRVATSPAISTCVGAPAATASARPLGCGVRQNCQAAATARPTIATPSAGRAKRIDLSQ